MEYIGIDVGGTWIKAGRFSSDLYLIHDVKVRSGASKGADSFFASIAAAIREIQVTSEPIGLAIPGPTTVDGTRIQFLANVAGLNVWSKAGIPVVAKLASYVAINQVVVSNDANCAALGEWHGGIGQADRAARLLLITWGTGIGSGFVADGVGHYGWEAGHLPLTFEIDGPTLETATQTASLLRQAQAAVVAATDTLLVSERLADPTEGSKHLVMCAEAGDVIAQQILDTAAEAIAHGLHSMALIAYPTIVALGGGMMASDWLLQRVQEHVARRSIGIRQTSLRAEMVHRAELGNSAGMLGAALLAKQQFG